MQPQIIELFDVELNNKHVTSKKKLCVATFKCALIKIYEYLNVKDAIR